MRLQQIRLPLQVEIQMAQGGEVLDDACIRRWLRADKWDVAAAETRLRTHAQWRVSVAPSGVMEQVISQVPWFVSFQGVCECQLDGPVY